MYKHLLVPLDGSPTSESALTQAIALAQTCDAAITVMMVDEARSLEADELA